MSAETWYRMAGWQGGRDLGAFHGHIDAWTDRRVGAWAREGGAVWCVWERNGTGDKVRNAGGGAGSKKCERVCGCRVVRVGFQVLGGGSLASWG